MKTSACSVMATGFQIEAVSVGGLCKLLFVCVDMVVTSGLEMFNELLWQHISEKFLAIQDTQKSHNKDNKTLSPV